MISLSGEHRPSYPLYQWFWENANYSGISKDQPPTQRDRNIGLMKDILPKEPSTTVKVELKEQPETIEERKCYELSWDEVKERFTSRMHFFQCLSLYFDFMPCKKPHQYPFPLKIKMKIFGHEGAFYILSRPYIFSKQPTGTPLERCLYIIAQDTDFMPTKQTKQSKQRDIAKDTFNFEAYKDISYLLNGDVELREANERPEKAAEIEFQTRQRQKQIAKHLLEALDGVDNQPELDPELFQMRIIRAMWMALIIPFVAETAPPPDKAARVIRDIYRDVQKGTKFDANMEDQLNGLGGCNPGCHELCYCLYQSIRDGRAYFKDVLLHPHPSNTAFTPSVVRGVHRYRCSMFDDIRGEAVMATGAAFNQVCFAFILLLFYCQ